MELLLIGLQSPINIGMILRVAESYQIRVSILDRYRVLDDPEKFGVIEDFACGSTSRWGFNRIEDDAALARLHEGRRLIVTSIAPDACGLPKYQFSSADIVAVGNEYDGLPDDVVADADAALHIPMPAIWVPKPKSRHPIDPTRTAPVAREGSPNLNVAMATAIICYTAYLQERCGCVA
jgi:tRNA G18 (ribose-2'-O)-methylase SpoU